ncbi:hypothetical protein BH10ACT9_BH10ACT9_14560 [soil metagenome]
MVYARVARSRNCVGFCWIPPVLITAPTRCLIGTGSARSHIGCASTQPESNVTPPPNAEAASNKKKRARGNPLARNLFERHSMQLTQPSTSVPSNAIWRSRM